MEILLFYGIFVVQSFFMKLGLPFLIVVCLLLVAAVYVFSGCKKADSPETLEAYMTRSGLISSVQLDSRGFYYKIVEPGTGVAPTVNNKVTLFYKGTLTDGTVFDQTGTAANYQSGNPITFSLSQLIPGWQLGLPLIKAGGTITLYLPPSLGYGSQSAGSIPPNSVLIFEIKLVSIG